MKRLAFVMLAVGCAAEPRVSVEANDLGIRSIEIEHTVNGADRLLIVRGFDARDVELASMTLRTGMVSYTYDAEVPPGLSMGTELSVTVGETKSPSMITPDLLPHVQAGPDEPDAMHFLLLRAVSRAVHDEAGITIVAGNNFGSDHEIAYDGNCDSNLFPTNKGNPLQCCEQTGNFIFTYQKTAAATLSKRSSSFGTVTCRTSDGSGRNCSGTGCTYGPCGLKAEWTYNTGVVFKPNGALTCGYDNFAGVFSPRAYNQLTDVTWPGVTAGCPAVTCCNTSNVAYPWNSSTCPSGPVFFDGSGFLSSIVNYGTTDQADLRTSGWNDRISSVLVPSGMSIRIWENINYSGASMVVVSPGIVNLADYGWDNRISSIDFL